MQVVIGLNVCRLWGSLCMIDLLRKVARSCHWLVWSLVPVSSLYGLRHRSVAGQLGSRRGKEAVDAGKMWLSLQSDRSWFYTVQVGVNFLYFFDVWAGDPTQTLAKRGTWRCDNVLKFALATCIDHLPFALASCSKPRPLPEIHMFLKAPLSSS